ncbi:MAG: hypothetical protein ABR514_06525, partial [Chthoniobacterales bacterium]
MEALSNQPSLDLEGYARLFDVKGALISGDITPAYSTLDNEIITRIMSTVQIAAPGSSGAFIRQYDRGALAPT